MSTTVLARHVARPRTATFYVGALALASGAAVHPGALTGQCLAWIGLVILVLVVVILVPAVWSARKPRRDAALAVLDRLLRWHW